MLFQQGRPNRLSYLVQSRGNARPAALEVVFQKNEKNVFIYGLGVGTEFQVYAVFRYVCVTQTETSICSLDAQI